MEPARRLSLLVSALLAVCVSAAPVAAQAADEPPTPPNPVPRIRVVRDLTFPVVGPARYEDSFGDCRDGCAREHLGIDIFSNGWKGVPVVAAHSGIVEKAEVYGRRATCAIHIRAADGWETRYLHLNTDTPGTDDGEFLAGCAAPGVTVGSYVAAGQIIGWLGDSGNAEHNSVHLHFELRTPKGTPVDPLRSLDRSEVVSFTMLDPEDPASAAITLSRIAYPEGAAVAFVTTTDDGAVDGIGLPWSARLTGPLVLTGRGGLDPATRAELVRLGPDVIVFLDREGTDSRALVADLASIAKAVERVPFPTAPERAPAPIAELVDRVDPRVEPGFRVVVVEDGTEVAGATLRALSDLEAVVATVRMMQSDSPAGERGLSVLTGPERPGKLRSVYFPGGTTWRHYPADGRAPLVPNGLIVLAMGGDVTASTLTFLRSLATVPPTPYWR